MPVYEYCCPGCQHRFEELVKTYQGASTGPECPHCGHRNVPRKLSLFAAHHAAAAGTEPARGCQRCGDPDGPCPLTDDYT